MNKLGYLYFLSSIKKLGACRIRNILYHYDTPERFFAAEERQYRNVEGIDLQITSSIADAIYRRKEIEDEFEKLIETLEKKEIKICSIFDDEYPENLKTISSSPVILYFKGRLSRDDRYSLGIVGTRVPTEYGKHTCEKLTNEVCALKIPVISGFARGIDTIAHKTSLRCGNLTYAVFGCGVDIVYPAENRKLYNEIIENGAVISEFPPGTKPDKMNFPRRNRIISGISLGTVVIESSIGGGAVLTAEMALEQNKEVFAVPGYIHSRQSEGTNELIKKGQAKLITGVDDIVSELERKLAPLLSGQQTLPLQNSRVNITKEERFVFEVIKREPIHIDDISDLAGRSVQECLVHLLSLEFKFLIRQMPGKFFSRN
ncbi:MAG: DNA-processing protein DprA [Ignavibacteria bacterium]